MKTFHGFHHDHELPIKKGDFVVIPKGTKIRTTHPQQGPVKECRKNLRVKVSHMLNGMSRPEWGYDENGKSQTKMVPVFDPQVVWAGTGGYWCQVDLNEVLKANESFLAKWTGVIDQMLVNEK